MKKDLIEGIKVAIIGGGPVGLTTAKLLQKAGANVQVYERDATPQARITGGTLDIHKETGQMALEKAGLLEKFYQYARPTGERITDINARILIEEKPNLENQYNRPEIDRNDLRKILLDSLDDNTVVWGSQLVAIEKGQDQYLLHFEDGNSAKCDLLIVANGGMSNARKYVTDAAPEYTGTFIIQGEVSNPAAKCPTYKKLCGKDNLVLIAEQKMLYSQVKGTDDLNYFVSFKASENWASDQQLDFNDKPAVLQFLNSITQTWNPCYEELFAATDTFTGLTMRRMPLDKPWKQHHNITLLGDAAHLMPPFAGIGVNTGLLDALYLAESLTCGAFDDIASALRNYEQKMFEYASAAQSVTAQAEEDIHSDMPVEMLMEQRGAVISDNTCDN